MIVTILLVILSLLLLFWLLVFPMSAWIAVRFSYPRRLRQIRGEPAFSVNLVVPCTGRSPYLEENLRAFAAQDYQRYFATFVTNTPEDDANTVIASVARGNPHVHRLVAGFSATCAPKVHAEIMAVASDPLSEVFLFADSDMRPATDWVREMVRPFLDPRVSVTTSHRWVQSDTRGLAASLYTILCAYSCVGLATRSWRWSGVGPSESAAPPTRPWVSPACGAPPPRMTSRSVIAWRSVTSGPSSLPAA